MRGTAPLLGVLTSPALPPTSRVPHLAAHILSRRSRDLPQDSRAQLQHTRTFKSSSRSLLEGSLPRRTSTVPLTGVFDENVTTSQTPVTIRDDGQDEVQYVKRESVEDEENPYNEEAQIHALYSNPHPWSHLRFLVKGGLAEPLRFVLRNQIEVTRNFIRNAEDAEFTSVLQTLDAKVLFSDYKHVYRHVLPSLTTQPVFRLIRTLEMRFEEFALELDRIIKLRREAGHKVNLEMCKIILKAAQFTGDARRAKHVFDFIMPQDGVQPDLECYNLLMEAMCWNHAFTKSEWNDLRVTHSRLRARRAQPNFTPPLRFSGHKVDFKMPDQPDTKLGLRVTVLARFRELVAYGLHGDEMTFTNIMVAMGREGDLAGVKSILKSVWNVDVDLLSAYDEEEIESPTFYEDGTPLRPSSRLLFTIVHVFGTNNLVGLAFVLLDYVSRNYNLLIHPDIWHELCVWTRVMSSSRSQSQKRKGEAEGQVNWRVFERLWEVMTDKPHNIIPDVPLLSFRTAVLLRARRLDETVDSIREMRAYLEVTREQAVTLFWEMMAEIEAVSNGPKKQGFLSEEFLQKRHDFVIASQIFERDLQEVIVATRRMLTTRSWSGAGDEYEWVARRLPTLSTEFADRAPNELSYHTPTGQVEMHYKEAREAALIPSRLMEGSIFHDTTWLGTMRQLLDCDDHDMLRSRIKAMLPEGRVRIALERKNIRELFKAVLEALGSQILMNKVIKTTDGGHRIQETLDNFSETWRDQPFDVEAEEEAEEEAEDKH